MADITGRGTSARCYFDIFIAMLSSNRNSNLKQAESVLLLQPHCVFQIKDKQTILFPLVHLPESPSPASPALSGNSLCAPKTYFIGIKPECDPGCSPKIPVQLNHAIIQQYNSPDFKN